jgi:hypothetical protein
MLGDAARLACGHVRLADGVQQAGLPVVHVTQNGHHRRTGLQLGLVLVCDHLAPERHLAGFQYRVINDLRHRLEAVFPHNDGGVSKSTD